MNPNQVTGALLLPLALALAGFLYSRTMMLRIGSLALIAILGTGMYSSMSRGALLSIVAMLAMFAYRLRSRTRVAVPVVILSTLIVIAPGTFHDRIAAFFSGADPTGSGRVEIWKVALSALDRFWIFGAGLRNFEDVYGIYVPSKLAALSSHNMYLAVWVELGIFGLALIVGGVVLHLRAASRTTTAGNGSGMLVAFEAACVGMLSLNIVGDQLFRKEFWLSWILLAWASSMQTSYASAPPSQPRRLLFGADSIHSRVVP
jgi:O-antigen ligase